MSIVESIFRTAFGRRKQQLSELLAQRDELNLLHIAAVSSGDDKRADKLFKEIDALDAQIRATRAAMEANERLEADQAQRAVQAEQAKRLAEYESAMRDYLAAVVQFEELVHGELVKRWLLCADLFEKANDMTRDNGCSRFDKNHLLPMRLWDRVWLRFLLLVNKPGKGAWHLPSQAPQNKTFESCAQIVQQEIAAADAARK